ncbi:MULTISPECIES: S26 family signal peptidase [Spongiibacter]|uniref:S26 family signal peptidase n=2 Tax=Spongiibacteraceae TaxID=1706375 RepID=UPI0026A66319
MRWHIRLHLWACFMVLLLMAGSLFALAWVAFTPPTARVIYNASDSVPMGWYRVTPLDDISATQPDAIAVDSIVLTRLPASVAILADQHGYLPLQVPLLKRVGAVAPEHVCISGGNVRIDGVQVAAILPADAQGRPLPVWQQCRPLVDDELFLLSNTTPASFDSRYFGPVRRKALLGTAHRLTLESMP